MGNCKHKRLMAYLEDGARYHACRDCKEVFPQPGPTDDGPPTDMFGNDLTKTDSFGTPVAQKVWVGRVRGSRTAKVPFNTVAEAEHFIAQLEVLYPKAVRSGNFYIDAPEAVDHA